MSIANIRLTVSSMSTQMSVNLKWIHWFLDDTFGPVTGLHNNETKLSTHFYIGWNSFKMNIHLDF